MNVIDLLKQKALEIKNETQSKANTANRVGGLIGDVIAWFEKFKFAVFYPEYDNGNSGAAKTIDFNNGQNQKITLTADCTFTLTPISIENSTNRVQITIYQDGTGEWDIILPSNCEYYDFDFTQGTANQFSIMTLYWNGTFWVALCTEWKDIPS
jgi:hypothetical protein